MDVDFLEFIKTGNFGLLKLGESKVEILNMGLKPDDYMYEETIESSPV